MNVRKIGPNVCKRVCHTRRILLGIPTGLAKNLWEATPPRRDYRSACSDAPSAVRPNGSSHSGITMTAFDRLIMCRTSS